MSDPSAYNLPATAVCPGCDTIVVLPAVVAEDSPLPICGTCGSEVPDYRREVAAAEAEAEAAAEVPIENRRYTRGSLLGALRDTVAEKGIAAINKRTPPNFLG
jgi:hypothetical protein